MKKLTIIFILFSLIIFPLELASAHPGRLDGNGCHHCWTKCKEKWSLEYGDYHCHESKKSKTKSKDKSKRKAKR